MIWLYIQRPIFCWISHILVNTLMPFFFLGPAQHKKSHPCWSSALCSYTFLVNWILLTPVWETLSRIKGFKDVEKCYNANIPLSFKYMFYPSTIISPNTINIINSSVLDCSLSLCSSLLHLLFICLRLKIGAQLF